MNIMICSCCISPRAVLTLEVTAAVLPSHAFRYLNKDSAAGELDC